ncbi:MAG: endonuclease [Bacteroidales bacterium]|nr:endonuclease [Bacteroidales bacterium]
MNKSIISGPIITFLFLIILLNRVYSQDTGSHPVRLMFYNVENLFDIYDDTLKDDDEFLPGGTKRWNLTRYNRKIDLLYKTLVAAGEWDTPDIVAFSEIENRKVLADLVSGTYLSKFKYGIVHEDSPDQRGIDVCLIYRKDCAEVIDYRYWIPSDVKREDFTSRSILYVKFLIKSDTIHLIVNHWPSRRGGVLAGEGLRVNIASMVREKADSIIRSSPVEAKIIILGDFNSTPDDREIKSLILPSDSGIILKNLSEYLSDKGLGTYRYMGTWELIDQIIVSEMLITCKNGLYTGSEMVTIFKPRFLLKKDPKYPGFSPYSTYRGYRYQGGYSDHLPVMLDLKIRLQDQQE